VKILTLGATGFLGNLVTRRLARQGHRIACLVRDADVARSDANFEYVQATLDDAQVIAEYAKDADFLLHFAWDTTPGSSKGQPTVETVNNLLPTFRLIEQLHSHSGCQLVFISSAGAVYDEGSVERAVETSPLNPRSYYGAGKLAAEMFLRAFSAQTSSPVVIVRPSNVYGPGQRVKRQFAIVPTLMRAISDGSVFNVWGNGESTRDYLFADDFAEFFVAVTDRRWQGVSTFNLASGHLCSVNDLCAMLEKVSGRKLSLEYLPERGVDLNGLEIDSSAAKRELGWQATTRLEDGLVKTWEWFVQSQ
jgi:UDP-glucose 4-epimerase